MSKEKKKITKDDLLKEISTYSHARIGTPQTFKDGVRQVLIAEELKKYKVNWREI